MSDGRVVIDSVFDDKGIEEGLKDFEKSMKSAGDKMTKLGKGLSTKVTAPMVATATAVGALALKTGDYADSVLDAADATGLSTDEIQRWESVTRQAGVSATTMTDAAGRLNRQWSSIESGSGKAAEAIEDMGLNVDELSNMNADERLNTLVGVLGDVEDKSERARLGSDLFGRQWEKVAPVVGMGSEELEKLKGSHDGVMTEEDLNKANNFRKSWETLKEEFAVAGRTIASDLIPILQDVLLPLVQDHLIPFISRAAEFVGKLAEKFAELSPKTQNTILVIAGLAAAIGPILVVVGKVISIIGSLAGAFVGFNPVVLGVVAVIAGLIVAITHLWQTNEEFREFIINAWNAIKDFAIETFTLIKDVLTEIWQSIQETAIEIWNRILEFWEKWGETILAFGEMIWETIKTVITTAIELIADIINLVLAAIRGDWSEVWEKVKSIASTIWDSIKDILSSVLNAIFDIFGSILSQIWDKVKEKFNDIKDSITETMSNVKDTIKRIWDDVMDFFKGINLFQIGKDIITGLWNGIKNMGSTLKRNVSKFISDNIPGPVKKILDIRSPSKVMEGLGEDTGEGFDIGLSGKIKDISKQAREIAQSAIPNVAPMAMAGGGNVNHSGTIRIEGVDNEGQFIDAVEMVIEGIGNPRARKAVSRAQHQGNKSRRRGLGV